MIKRLLVLSDSHGNNYNIERAVKKHFEAAAVVFLGDGIYDVENVDISHSKTIIKVKGNCDLYDLSPECVIEEINGNRIYITHGYREMVKHSLDNLISSAKKNTCNIVLYGHTHEQFSMYESGIWFINPGSIKYGEYALLDIGENNQIMPILNKL